MRTLYIGYTNKGRRYEVFATDARPGCRAEYTIRLGHSEEDPTTSSTTYSLENFVKDIAFTIKNR